MQANVEERDALEMNRIEFKCIHVSIVLVFTGDLGSAGLEYLTEKPRNRDIPAGVKPLNGTPDSRDPWKPESGTSPLNPVKVINSSYRERRGPGGREPTVGVAPASGIRTRFPEGYESNFPQASSGRQAPG